MMQELIELHRLYLSIHLGINLCVIRPLRCKDVLLFYMQ